MDCGLGQPALMIVTYICMMLYIIKNQKTEFSTPTRRALRLFCKHVTHVRKSKNKHKGWWQRITGTWTYKETSWRPSFFPWAGRKQRPAHESEARTSEHNSHPFSILDRCGPSAKHDVAVHGSHFVLLVWDRIEGEKVLWHCWQ